MRQFIGNPKTGKLESVDGDPGTGLYCYRYDDTNMKLRDLREILKVTELILESTTDVKIVTQVEHPGLGTLHLSIKHRENIHLGLMNLK